MSSDRLQFQTWVEKELGCTNLTQWTNFKTQLNAFTLGTPQLAEAQAAIAVDAISLFTKALVSFCGGVHDIANGHINWGLVKLYYSLFYSSRANLCAKRQGMVRNQSWYRIDLTSANRTAIRLAGNRYRNDHDATLHLYEDLYRGGDPLLSNSVDNKTPYEWMMETRNLVHYRLALFSDPDFPSHIKPTFKLSNLSEISTQLDVYLTDATNAFTFQPEHAWLAIPFKQIIQTSREIRTRRIAHSLPALQFLNIESISRFLSTEGQAGLELQSILSAQE
ncbi:MULTISPECIES: hypothetical protein [unclassified Polaromonas]|jgi:hypothetical protein|uniref:hypothetical protein n=1 Tax=unclassified Polaromonas TaxID=2638319 RepID=UPI0025F0EA67|nr:MULTISPECIES: hypothetical protein [unclassified Polaromonas]HQR98282.1 hypothetical protein [Polaromonas sp.]HQS39282.1 hypothetical protein [Polaromonas sp.]HQS86571.1 hypothetical protein [Polaromonas sp.]HQT06797.1 hypothetical protein [Polaromonas sp.]